MRLLLCPRAEDEGPGESKAHTAPENLAGRGKSQTRLEGGSAVNSSSQQLFRKVAFSDVTVVRGYEDNRKMKGRFKHI